MSCTRRSFVFASSVAAMLGLASCSNSNSDSSSTSSSQQPEEQQKEPEVDLKEFEKLTIDMKAWKYDKKSKVYYQLGIPYCLNPVSDAYESLAIFVPGAYLEAADDSDKPEYKMCEKGKVGNYTAATAPILMPINSGNLGPQTCPTAYDHKGLAPYMKAGCIYVYAGFRGRSSGYESGGGDVFSGGDPWPVVDLKAAIRYLRYNSDVLPGDSKRIFTFGFSAGGGVSAVMGSAGDSKLFDPYLKQIGAATHDAKGKDISDGVFGSASWCPITSFDAADAAYEWMMGQYSDEGTRAKDMWTKLFSNDLATAYAAYINEMDLRDGEDQPLVLDETAGELFADGSYYTGMLECIQNAATSFFSHVEFPYTYTPGHLVNASFPGDPNLQSVGSGASDIEAVTGDASAQAAGVSPDTKTEGKASVESVVYATEDDYLNDLNGDSQWLTFNQTRETVRIASMADFVRKFKAAAKDVGAFDALDRSTIVNQLFGTENEGSLHFSRMMYDQLAAGQGTYAKAKGWNKTLVESWKKDLAEVDSLKTNMDTRINMFNPLYFLSGHYKGFGTATVAAHWRINSGLFQTDTSLCTEYNLAVALQHYDGVADVAFTPVWGQGHVLAEESGTAEQNLLAWVDACCK